MTEDPMRHLQPEELVRRHVNAMRSGLAGQLLLIHVQANLTKSFTGLTETALGAYKAAEVIYPDPIAEAKP